ncbi:hypothetical protein BDV93DRAFT_522010 [Ceratobasidium sp. AG-I]|nr:hypothetical protein BDV93DRAFT_522010 [Ceratobasidium sp. AG-I]
MTAICSICQEKLSSGHAFVLSLCGHVCCDGCLIQWAARNNPPNRVDCPMCRKKHSYPKNTIKLFFEEEKSEPELFRSEIRAVIRLVQQCADEPSGATLANVVEELKALSKTAKKLKEHQVSAASVNGLDAMVSHLSKKLAPMQSTENLHAELLNAQAAIEQFAAENTQLRRQYADSRARLDVYANKVNALSQDNSRITQDYSTLSRQQVHMEEQIARQRQKAATLQKQLSECEESRDNARERILHMKKKCQNLSATNEMLKLQVNRALSERKPSVSSERPTASRSMPRPAPRHSVISIGSSPGSDLVTFLTSGDDDQGGQGSESSSVEFISDSDDENQDPMPKYRAIKPVKPPAGLFGPAPQASSSKPMLAKPPQKRKLALPGRAPPAGLELRNGKLTGVVVTGPKRTRKA